MPKTYVMLPKKGELTQFSSYWNFKLQTKKNLTTLYNRICIYAITQNVHHSDSQILNLCSLLIIFNIQLKNGSRFSSMSYDLPEPIYGSTTATSSTYGSTPTAAQTAYNTGRYLEGCTLAVDTTDGHYLFPIVEKICFYLQIFCYKFYQ